jgi:hypothetical protein
MADTKRQDIIDALLVRLALILTASGYQTNAGANLSEWRSDVDELAANEIPSLCIYDTTDDWEPEAFGQYRYKHKMSVIIEGIAKASTSPTVTAMQNARKIIQDIHACIGSDRTLGAVADWIEPKSDRLIVKHAENKFMACQVTLEISYTTINYGTTA